ncbi:hypothetical protein UFOVP456_48 [uncultured Caudovirales phage]|jgi:hypothetical protein|uniref:DUF6817 domain-containing protein n=1 Tax=uncultured Caudovirales phage TaxID=2100421 RepID=A0A6J5MEE7_9CAUD|nr:hypothetical protein UFOVP456_48 [uncultured Caudovirales phage]
MTPREFIQSLDLDRVPHSGRTFVDHLHGVEDILRLCRCSETVCNAGLFHSIYGTTFFDAGIKVSRDDVVGVIGKEAEYLSWLFCNANRPFCWFCGNKIAMRDGSHVLVDNKTLHDLQMIEGANLLEQQCGADMIVATAARAQ